MENSNSVKIDYTEKIRTFQALVDNYNEEIALNYLTKANWDEAKAAQIFFSENTNSNPNSNRNSKTNNLMGSGSPHYIDDINSGERTGRRSNQGSYQEVSQNENEMNEGLIGNNRTRQEQPGFISRYIVKPIVWFGSFFCNRSERVSEEENRIFSELPEKINNLNSFTTMIKTRIGILVLYQQTDLEYFTNFINEIKSESYIMDILKVNFVIYPVLLNSSEGKRIQSLIADPMLYPAMVFAFNKRGNNTFNRGSILDRLEGHITADVFRDALIRNIETRDRGDTNKTTDSHVDLIKQQQEELEHLERLENERKNKEREEKLKAEREKEEKRKKEEEQQNLIKQKLNSLPPEPEADNPNSAYIIFRYPDGSRRAERRFLKSHSVKVLYDYVDSLGADVFEESDKYELIQPFPFKLYNNMERTLEEEGLFPNAVLQIREI